MGLAINTKVSAINPRQTVKRSMGRLYGSLEVLSSGLRIGHGAGNPTGLAAAERFRANVQDPRTWLR